MEKNDKGQTAIAYYQPIPRVVKINDVVYIFDVKRAISLAWVNDEHVPNILSITKQCCGGHTKTVYRYATPDQVTMWSGKGR